MAKYKVSYKVLSEQGGELKKLAKLVGTYGDKVKSVQGKLGDDDMLAEIRNNLQKLAQQMEETRAVMNLAGELLSKSVDSYTQTESRGVKKVDAAKAHKRDFYKQPVVVASAGGAASAVSAPTPTTTNINYTETTNITYNEAPAASAGTAASVPLSDGGAVPVSTQPAASAAPAPAAAATAAAAAGTGSAAGVGVAAGLGGVAVGVGATLGASHLAEKKKNGAESGSDSGEYDPEAELAEAMERARRLEGD